MAVRIPIVTVFDSKGLKQAQYQLNKVRGNFQNLGRNFALAGAAFAGAAAIITKSARDLARIESINAQTAQTIKSMGNAANISAGQVEQLAGRLEAMTATEAEAIQEGANLLLTFGNITNQLGKGNDIFTQTTEIMVDMGRALKRGPVDTATMLGKALNDPIRGMTALRRVGVSFTDQQVEQVKALQKSGDLMGAQKLILAELQNQYGGSGAAYAATFAGQVELLNHELGALGEEATMAVMPALQELVGALREIAPEIGIKLKTALASVDWQAFGKAIVDTINFLITHGETIVRTVAVLWTLNTAYNAVKVAVGLTNAALTLFNIALGNTEVAAKKTTGIINGLKTALLLGGVVLAVGSVIDEYRRLKGVIESTNTQVKEFDKQSIAVSGAASKLNPINTIWQKITLSILGAITANRQFNNESGGGVSAGVMASEARRDAAMAARGASGAIPGLPSLESITTPSAGGGSSSRPDTVAQVLKREGVLATREAKLLKTGVSQGLAGLIVGTATTKKSFQKELKKLTSSTTAVSKAQAKFNKTQAGKNELASIQAQNDANDAIAEANRQAAIQAAAEQAARDAAILAEKQRVYESFASSISNLFSRIQESILSAFSLPELGGSTDSIIRNMDKLLTRVKAFSANITKLSSMGLDPKLLQQVINAGPIAGAKLAANLVAGGVGGLAAINKGYSELGGLASEIGMTGTQAQFGTAQQQQIININIEGGLDSSAAIGKAVVDAVRAYERTSGAVWQGA
jgi:hypothetical protein